MAIAKLMHPNIVQVFAFGEDAGRHFFAMQFVQGESLADRLHRQGRLPLDEALSIFEHCLAGLAAAHARGLIHRDIKPGNVLIDREHNRALVADFGLVKTTECGDNRTATGVIMGTVDYISPEQARGQKVDGRSDLYSLGALMYQTLCGRTPFVSESATGLIFQHAFEQPRALSDAAPDVPKRIVAIIMRLLAKDPAHRYSNAEDVLADIQAFVPVNHLRRTREASRCRESLSHRALPCRRSPRACQPCAPAGKWRDRFWNLLYAHAPQVAQKLADTQHQVDGAVVQYERRRDELAELARAAAAVAAEFATQAASHREAAVAAAKRAEKATDPEVAAQSREDQARCERIATEFESQLAEQEEQSEEIQLRLSKVNATLQQLRSQRDVLQARLRSAQQRMASEGLRPRVRIPRRLWAVIAGCAMAAILVAWLLSNARQEAVEKSDLSSKVSNVGSASPTATSKTVAPAIDRARLLHGLLVTEYPRHPRQDSKNGGFVPLEELGDPIGKSSMTSSLTQWAVNPRRNVVAEGLLKIEIPGEYRFRTKSYNGRNVLYINGTPICIREGGKGIESGIDARVGSDCVDRLCVRPRHG